MAHLENLSLLTDLYEFTMAAGFKEKLDDTPGVFDVFYRRVPDSGSFVILSGIEEALLAIKNFHFDESDIAYLRSLAIFDEEFLSFLLNFENKCEIRAISEGTPVFPREPLMTITGPLYQAQLYETIVLNLINHQSLIATKAYRISEAAEDHPVLEMGARRAQGPSAAIYGARAAVIGGVQSTSNVLAGKKFNIPVVGTMAHSWVEAFTTEYEAFSAWSDLYPDNCSLLVDTYDILKSGIPNAIKVFTKLKAQGYDNFGIRIDSGDITALSRRCRKLLNEAGFPEAKIGVSNSLNEHIIASLITEGADIDLFGVGESLITSSSAPVLSGVFKLAAVKKADHWVPKIKMSASRGKLTLPGLKQVYRLYNQDGEPFADLIALRDEELSAEMPVVKADPLAIDPSDTLKDFTAKALLEPALNGEHLIMEEKDVFAIQAFSKAKIAELPKATHRLLNPHQFPVYITRKLHDLQQEVIAQHAGK